MGRFPVPSLDGGLYGDETADVRAWAAAYIARNRDLLDLMARL